MWAPRLRQANAMLFDLHGKPHVSSRPNGMGESGGASRGEVLQHRARLAYLVSHPIQYQVPLLRLLSAQPDIDLTVFFERDLSTGYHDPGFGRVVQWDVSLLEGYRHEFLARSGETGASGRLIWDLVRRLWRREFDVLWIHGYARWINWVAMVVAWLRSVPILVRDEAHATSARRSPTKARLKLLFFGVLAWFCDGFLAIGTLNRDYYIRNGIDQRRIFLVPYCVDNDFFASRARAAVAQRGVLRAELGLASGRPVILYAAKFQARKRAGDLLLAFQTLTAEVRAGDRPYLLFVGDGELRPALEKRAEAMKGDVKFLGFRNQSELPALFDLCDIFVLPSDSEPWGLAVNEAMSVGRAIVVSDQVGCAPDLVKNGVNGFVCPVGDIKALADALANITRSRETLAAMGAASAAVIAHWDYQRDLCGLRRAIAAVTERRQSQ